MFDRPISIAACVCALLAPATAAAQEHAVVQGRVTTTTVHPRQCYPCERVVRSDGETVYTTSNPEAGVFVRIDEVNAGVPTRHDGTYRMVIPAARLGSSRSVRIIASRPGLESQSRIITLSPGAQLVEDFEMIRTGAERSE